MTFPIYGNMFKPCSSHHQPASCFSSFPSAPKNKNTSAARTGARLKLSLKWAEAWADIMGNRKNNHDMKTIRWYNHYIHYIYNYIILYIYNEVINLLTSQPHEFYHAIMMKIMSGWWFQLTPLKNNMTISQIGSSSQLLGKHNPNLPNHQPDVNPWFVHGFPMVFPMVFTPGPTASCSKMWAKARPSPLHRRNLASPLSLLAFFPDGSGGTQWWFYGYYMVNSG